jgi:hypothetical protein
MLEKVSGLSNTLSPSEMSSKSHCRAGGLADCSRLITEESSLCPRSPRRTLLGDEDDAEKMFKRSRAPSDGRLSRLEISDWISVARSFTRFEDGPGPLFVRRIRSLSCEKSHTKVQSLPVFVQFEHGPRGNVPGQCQKLYQSSLNGNLTHFFPNYLLHCCRPNHFQNLSE